MEVRFLKNCAGREKGTVENVNDGMATIWIAKGYAIRIRGGKKKEKEMPKKEKEKEKEKEPKKKSEEKKDLKDPQVTRHFAGAPIRK